MRRIRQRRIVALIATAACVAALAGCGRQEAAGPPVLHFYTPADGAAQYAAAADDCTAAAGGRYSVVHETLPKSADDQRLQLARRLVAGDPALDLMAMDVTWTAEFAEAGWIRPFPEDVARQVEAGTLRAAYDTGTYQDQLWAAPLNTNTQLLWYRKDLVPNPPGTWDEMIDMAVVLAERDLPHFVEVQEYEGLTVWFNTLLASAGGQIVSEDGAVLVDDGDAALRVAAIMKRLATSPAADPSLSVPRENDARLQFEAGLAAFQVNYPFVYASLLTPPPEGGGGGTYIDEFGRPTDENTGRRVIDVTAWTAYPSVIPGRPASVTIGGLNIAVSSTGEHPDLAFEAVQCLRNRENQLRNAVEAGVPPTLVELYDDPQFRQEYPAWQAIRDSLQNASVRPETPAYQSISIVVADLLNPPSQIDLDTIVPLLAEQVEGAVQSEGLVP
jgi:multiple sugar transport system substrate-binding protein